MFNGRTCRHTLISPPLTSHTQKVWQYNTNKAGKRFHPEPDSCCPLALNEHGVSAGLTATTCLTYRNSSQVVNCRVKMKAECVNGREITLKERRGSVAWKSNSSLQQQTLASEANSIKTCIWCVWLLIVHPEVEENLPLSIWGWILSPEAQRRPVILPVLINIMFRHHVPSRCSLNQQTSRRRRTETASPIIYTYWSYTHFGRFIVKTWALLM